MLLGSAFGRCGRWSSWCRKGDGRRGSFFDIAADKWRQRLRHFGVGTIDGVDETCKYLHLLAERGTGLQPADGSGELADNGDLIGSDHYVFALWRHQEGSIVCEYMVTVFCDHNRHVGGALLLVVPVLLADPVMECAAGNTKGIGDVGFGEVCLEVEFAGFVLQFSVHKLCFVPRVAAGLENRGVKLGWVWVAVIAGTKNVNMFFPGGELMRSSVVPALIILLFFIFAKKEKAIFCKWLRPQKNSYTLLSKALFSYKALVLCLPLLLCRFFKRVFNFPRIGQPVVVPTA